jgi:cell division septal protein FtsQ
VKVKAATEKNFRRARSKPARRRRLRALFSWRLARVLLIGAIVVYASYRAFELSFNAAALHISRIRVHGNVRLSSGEVQTIVRDLQGANILTANLARSRRVLLQSPWVSEVAMRRVLPSTIDVYVSERRPFGLCRLGDQLYLIDRDGTVVDEFGPRYAEFDLPIVDGLTTATRPPRNGKPTIDEDRAELAARVVDAIQGSKELTKRVSQIDVSDAHDAVVLLDNDPALLHVGEERFRERLQSYLEIAGALRDRIPDIDYVDLRFEQRVYVKPRGRAERSAMNLTTGKAF